MLPGSWSLSTLSLGSVTTHMLGCYLGSEVLLWPSERRRHKYHLSVKASSCPGWIASEWSAGAHPSSTMASGLGCERRRSLSMGIRRMAILGIIMPPGLIIFLVKVIVPLNRRHLDGILLDTSLEMHYTQDWQGVTAAFSSVAHLQSTIDSEACTKAEHSTLVSPSNYRSKALQRKSYRIYAGAE
ncbi:hypothetical protein FA13DRAFT_1718209, partial [Coprinellus micaceus]